MPALKRAISAFIMCSPSSTRRLNDSRSAVSDACGSSASSASSPSSARIFFNSSSDTCRQSESSSRSSRSGTAGVRAKRPIWGSSITISKSFAPELRRNQTDPNVIPFTFTFTCRTSARSGLFIRPPKLGTCAPGSRCRSVVLLKESVQLPRQWVSKDQQWAVLGDALDIGQHDLLRLSRSDSQSVIFALSHLQNFLGELFLARRAEIGAQQRGTRPSRKHPVAAPHEPLVEPFILLFVAHRCLLNPLMMIVVLQKNQQEPSTIRLTVVLLIPNSREIAPRFSPVARSLRTLFRSHLI